MLAPAPQGSRVRRHWSYELLELKLDSKSTCACVLSAQSCETSSSCVLSSVSSAAEGYQLRRFLELWKTNKVGPKRQTTHLQDLRVSYRRIPEVYKLDEKLLRFGVVMQYARCRQEILIFIHFIRWKIFAPIFGLEFPKLQKPLGVLRNVLT